MLRRVGEPQPVGNVLGERSRSLAHVGGQRGEVRGDAVVGQSLVEQPGPHVVVAGDEPGPERVAVVDRVVIAQPAEQRIWVAESTLAQAPVVVAGHDLVEVTGGELGVGRSHVG
jgi:hypothetical protein